MILVAFHRPWRPGRQDLARAVHCPYSDCPFTTGSSDARPGSRGPLGIDAARARRPGSFRRRALARRVPAQLRARSRHRRAIRRRNRRAPAGRAAEGRCAEGAARARTARRAGRAARGASRPGRRRRAFLVHGCRDLCFARLLGRGPDLVVQALKLGSGHGGVVPPHGVDVGVLRGHGGWWARQLGLGPGQRVRRYAIRA